MTDDKRPVSLLIFYLISFAALVVSGLIYKTLFVAYNYGQFSSLTIPELSYALIWGVRFDIASAGLLSLISSLILWGFYRLSPSKNPAPVLLVIMLVLQLSMQIGDIVYYAEAGRHVSYEMRDALTDASGLFMTAITKHAMFFVLSYLLAIVIIISISKFSSRLFRRYPRSGTAGSGFRLKYELQLVLILLLSIVSVRGGVSGVPQGVISAFKIGDAQQAIVAMNGAYSVVYGVINSSKEVSRVSVKLPDSIDVNKVMRSLYTALPAVNDHGQPVKKYNLVFVLMEGWAADLMSSYGYEEVTTPFFDSLKEKSLAPLGVISGGVRTTEGIYAIFCSQQNPLGETVAQSSLQNNQYACLPDLLKRQGWHTAFFQGSHKETSGTGAFAQSLGFTDSHAKEDMPIGRFKHNYWGAHDPDIYDYVLENLDEMPQPFLVGINTNSTHDIRVPPGVKPFFGNANSKQKHESILHFADQAMKEFFDKFKDRPYYKDTIFVLLSDHTGGKHKSIAAKYFIPGIIFSEGITPVSKVNRYISQRDFSPTVLELLGLPASTSFSGKSLLSETQGEYFADYFDAGSVGWITGDSLVETSVNKPSDMKCYSLEKGLVDAIPVQCDEGHRNRSEQSLVFTAYSQDLLFEGKTKDFYDFFSK
jgi:phosphoglycerol transferase MdoB-like AlkP superfamily enzyme